MPDIALLLEDGTGFLLEDGATGLLLEAGPLGAGGGYWAPRYWPVRAWAPRYWPPGAAALPPEPSLGGPRYHPTLRRRRR